MTFQSDSIFDNKFLKKSKEKTLDFSQNNTLILNKKGNEFLKKLLNDFHAIIMPNLIIEIRP